MQSKGLVLIKLPEYVVDTLFGHKPVILCRCFTLQYYNGKNIHMNQKG